MSTRVQIKVQVGSREEEVVTLDLTATRPGDNPRYYASEVRAAILDAATRVDGIIAGAFGDIGKRAIGSYTNRLVAGDGTREAASPREITGGEG